MKPFTYLLFFHLIILLNCKQVDYLYTQVGELAELDISKYFNIINNQLDVNSQTNSEFQIDQPLTMIKEKQNGMWPLVLQFNQRKVSEKVVQRVEIVIHSQKNYRLRLLNFTDVNGEVNIEQIAIHNFQGGYQEFGNLIMYHTNRGVFGCKQNGQYQIGHFNLKQNTKQIEIKYYQVQAESKILYVLHQFENIDESVSIQLLIQSPQDLSVSLIQLLPTNQIQVIQQIQSPCKSKYFTQIISDLGSFIFCKDEKEYHTLQIFGLTIENKKIQIYPSDSLQLRLDTLLDHKIINGRLMLVNLIRNSNKKFYVTDITLDKSYRKISVQSKRVAIQNSLQFTYNVDLQNENFLIIVTDSYIMGVCLLKQQIIFQHRTFFISQYQLISSFSVFKNTFLIYNQYQISSQEIYLTQIRLQKPIMRFTQKSTANQIYKVELKESFKNDYIIIKSMPLISNSELQTPVSLTSSQPIVHHIITNEKSQLKINLEDFVIGSNLQIQASQFLSQPSISINAKLQSIDLISITSTNFEDITTFRKIHSTSKEYFLAEKFKYDRTLICIFFIRFDKQFQTQIEKIYENEITSPVLHVDKNGLLITRGGSLNNEYTFYLFEVILGLRVQPFIVNFQCNVSNDNLVFDSDDKNQLIFIFCENSIKQISYTIKPEFSYLIKTAIDKPFEFNLPQKLLVFQGKLIATDHSKIIIYDYISQFLLETIQIPDISLQVKSILLFQDSFVSVYESIDKNFSLIQYSYKSSSQNNYAIQLRTLLTIDQLSISSQNIIPVYQISKGCKLKEFLIISGVNYSSSQTELLIYRINNVKAQNQLYKKLIISKGKDIQVRNVFYAKNLLGVINLNNHIQIFSVQYYNQLLVNYQINKKITFNERVYQELCSKFIIKSLNEQDLNIQIQLQKDISAVNATFEEGDQQIEAIQSLLNQQSLSFFNYSPIDLNNLVKSNVLGWQINEQFDQLQSKVSIRQRIEQRQIDDGEIFDSIKLIDNLFAFSSPYLITIGNEKIEIKQFKYCYLYLDDSTINVQKNGRDTITSLKFYSFCWGETKSIQQFFIFNFKCQYNDKTMKQQIRIILENIYSKAFTDTEQQYVVSKIQSNEQLGLFSLIKPSYGSDMPYLCLIELNNQNYSFQLDCSSLSYINSLGILDIVWIDSIQSSLYISSSGIVYHGISWSKNSIFKVNLKKMYNFCLYNKYYQKNIVIAGQGNRNSFYISYDSNDVYEIQVIKGKDNLSFQLSIQSKFYGEADLAFSGYGLQISNSQSILAAKNLTSGTYTFLLYESYSDQSREKIIKSSIQLNVPISSNYNGCIKLLQKGDKVMYILNSHPYKLSTSAILDIHKDIKVEFLQNQNVIYNGVEMFLQLKSTKQNKYNTIPIQINFQEPKQISSSYQALLIANVIFIICIFV